MPEVPALCIRCIETERNTEWLHDAAHKAWEYGWDEPDEAALGEADLFSHQQIVENRLW